MKSVSVITLTYKNLDQLQKTIDSFLAQRFRNVSAVQYIIADDGTENFCEDEIYSSIGSSRLKEHSGLELLVYSNPLNVGTVRSFNRAIEKSTGELVIPLSCGDEFSSPNTIDQIVESFENSRSPIITGYREIVDNGRIVDIAPHKYLVGLFKPGKEIELLKYIAVRGNFISGASAYYSKSFLDRIGGFDEQFKLLEDYPMFLRALHEGHHIEFVKRVFMRHAVGGVSDPNSPANTLLKKDFELADQWILNNVDLDVFSKRLVKFLRPVKNKGRFSLYNIAKFPDCFVYWATTRVLSKIGITR